MTNTTNSTPPNIDTVAKAARLLRTGDPHVVKNLTNHLGQAIEPLARLLMALHADWASAAYIRRTFTGSDGPCGPVEQAAHQLAHLMLHAEDEEGAGK